VRDDAVVAVVGEERRQVHHGERTAGRHVRRALVNGDTIGKTPQRTICYYYCPLGSASRQGPNEPIVGKGEGTTSQSLRRGLLTRDNYAMAGG